MKTTIRDAGAADIPLLETGLRALAQDLGDPYLAPMPALAAACHGPQSFARALVVECSSKLVAVTLFIPTFSTIGGGAGTIVTDLWVDKAHRGEGLGRRLLAAVAERAKAAWGASFLKLSVYDNNPRAAVFYSRLGFTVDSRERVAVLQGDAMAALTGALADEPVGDI